MTLKPHNFQVGRDCKCKFIITHFIDGKTQAYNSLVPLRSTLIHLYAVSLARLLVPIKGLFGGSMGQAWMPESGPTETHILSDGGCLVMLGQGIL